MSGTLGYKTFEKALHTGGTDVTVIKGTSLAELNDAFEVLRRFSVLTDNGHSFSIAGQPHSLTQLLLFNIVFYLCDMLLRVPEMKFHNIEFICAIEKREITHTSYEQ